MSGSQQSAPAHLDTAQLAVALSQLSALSVDMGEVKITMKELAAAVTKLAVVEAHQANDRAALARAFKELELHELRIKGLEQAQPLQNQSSTIVRQAVALILAAVLGAGVSGLLHQKEVIPPLLERRQLNDQKGER